MSESCSIHQERGLHAAQSRRQHGIHTDKLRFHEYSNTFKASVLSHAVARLSRDSSPTNALYMDHNGLATILATKRSAGVAWAVNPRNALCTGDEACKLRNWRLWSPGQTSPKVQNRLISDSTKRIVFKKQKNLPLSKTNHETNHCVLLREKRYYVYCL